MFIYSGLLVGITAGAHHAAGDIHQSGCILKEPHTKSSFFSLEAGFRILVRNVLLILIR